MECRSRPVRQRDEWTCVRTVMRGWYEVDPLSSLEYNVIVAEILEAACLAE